MTRIKLCAISQVVLRTKLLTSNSRKLKKSLLSKVSKVAKRVITVAYCQSTPTMRRRGELNKPKSREISN